MQTVTINFTVSGQTLKVTSLPIKIASNTVKYVKAVFALDSDWTGFDVVSAIWYNDFAQIAVVLDENGECMIPHEVLAKPDDVMVNLVGRDVVNDELVDRLTTYPAKALDVDANAKITGTETAPVTPSQFEQYIAIVEQLVGSVKDIDHTELNADYTLTIYYTDGTSDTVGPIRGAQGEAGNGILSAVLNPDYTLTLNYTNGQHDTVGPIRGAQGETGNGIQSIYLTGTSGAVKTYTILFTDGNTTEFQVTDGEVTNAVLESLMPTDTASGAIASFPDGQSVFPLKSLVADIDTIQDLHGYDSPWVAGGGKNKINESDYTTSQFSYSNGTFTNTATDTRTNFQIYLRGYKSDNTYDTLGNLTASSTGTKSITFTGTNDYVRLAVVHNGSQTNLSIIFINIALSANTQYTFSLNVIGYNPSTVGGLSFKEVQVEKGSTATTWTPYSNICPISGWNSVGVIDVGSNLWDEVWELGSINFTTGALQNSSVNIRSKNLIPIKEGKTYFGKAGSLSSSSFVVFFYKADGTTYISNAYGGNTTFTAPSNAKYMRFYCGSAYGTTYNNDISINYPSTDTSYHAYNGTTHTTTLPSTVYGGTLDVVSGVLTIDKKQIVFDSNTSWQYSSSFFFLSLSDMEKPPTYNDRKTGIICSMYPPSRNISLSETMDDNSMLRVGTTLYIKATSYGSDVATFKSSVIGGQLVYNLATPTTIQLTPTQVQTLLGTNNIFADSGDVSVEYVADIQGYIDKKL